MDALRELATFISGLTYEALPAPVVARARMIARDTVGVIVGGMAEPEVTALADHAAAVAPGPVGLFGHRGRITPAWAALVHGTAGTTLEMDEGHAFARGHAAIHAVPPALALAEAAGADGREALTALVAGYEVAARVGVGTRLWPAVHPFGAWGVLGAAAVAARFKGYDAEALAGTLELAASYAITPSFATATQGATVRNTYAGLVNRLGMLAADVYGLGFRGERGGLATTFGQILGERYDPLALTDGLGERYELLRGYFKPYSACRYAHAAVDAALALRDDGPIDAEALVEVRVDTYDIAAHLDEPAPESALAGRFSIPYVVAVALLHGSAGPEAFAAARLRDPAVRALAARVRLFEDPALTAMTPARRPTRVTLRWQDGRQRNRLVTGSKGDPDQPMTDDELRAKFIGMTRSVLGDDAARLAWDYLGGLDAIPDLSQLGFALAPAKEVPSNRRAG